MIDPLDTDPPPAVIVETHERVATVTLNRPERRNAVSWQLLVELIDALERVRADAAAAVMVITGAGRDFCVGADLARAKSPHASDHESRTLRGISIDDDLERLGRASLVAEILLTFPKPTIAKINGACAGAGLSIALATDYTVAASRAMINTAFVGAGVSGDLGSAWLLTRAVGTMRARALLLDPVKLTAAEAAELGMVTEVSSDLDARVDELSRKFAHQAPLAMGYAKQNVLDAATQSFTDYLPAEVRRMVETSRSDDARAAARAFIEKRNPA
ncbi:enoyl-CoA hydratase/isomerase family protein [Nocardioides sp. NPDC087217]|uniref:enoyl-CoA hydratase/isomerase family protein n=1 Tax=Nocardioides sp. NPDC087217 TaxID=3364335 RepID=UPI00381F5880